MAVGTKVGRERGYQNAIECSTRGTGTLITFGNVGELWGGSGVQCEGVGRQGSGGLSHVSRGSVLQTPPLPLPLLPLLPPHPFPLPLHHRDR